MKQYQKLFEMEGAELEFTHERPAARSPSMAKAKDTGARGLRSIVEDVMLDIMFELPDRAAKDKGKFLVTAGDRPQGEEPLRLRTGADHPAQVGPDRERKKESA